MKILDKNEKLLAYVIKKTDIQREKNFVSKNQDEFQFASFNLNSGTTISKHVHPQQERTIFNTSEVLIVIQGKLRVDIFDDNKERVQEVILKSGDSICLISGGHGIETISNCKFIEVKQGPYTESKDKVLF
jgi:cupin fold WbuC family metalloprotein